MSLKIRVVKLGQSYYLLIPSAIAKLAGVQGESVFSMSIKQDGSKVILLYEAQGQKPVELEDPIPAK